MQSYTPEDCKTCKLRNILFPASEQAAEVLQLGNGAIDNPSSFVSAQWSTVLSCGIGSSIGTVWRDHLDPEFFHCRVLCIAGIVLVPNPSRWLEFRFGEIKGLLHHVCLSGIGRCHRKAQRKPLRINEKLKFCSLAFTGESNLKTSSLCCRKSRINKSLYIEVRPLWNNWTITRAKSLRKDSD